MDYNYLQQIFGKQNEDDNPLPAIRLLKANHAPFIISFLYQEFKTNNKITIPNYILINHLADYIENIDDNQTDLNLLGNNIEKAKKYIDDWSNNEYIRKYPDETGEQLHELTSYSEKIIKWLENLKPKEFIGTESRLKDIINRLKELISESTEDPKKKIKELNEKKENVVKEIDRQIRNIKQTWKVDSAFSIIQIKERFENISEDARNLLSDFKEVENNFGRITKQIIEKQLNDYTNKGKLLKYMLDETEALEESSQGKSFYAFYDFLRFETGQTELDKLLVETYSLISKKNIDNTDKFLKNLKFTEKEDTFFDDLFNQFEVNKKKLSNNIRKTLLTRQAVSLKEILNLYPIKKGIPELLTYFSIASESENHIIESKNKDIVIISETDNKKISIPRVIYTK